MKNRIKKHSFYRILLNSLLLVACFINVSCNLILNQIRDPIVRINISGSMVLDETERQIVFEKTFKPRKQVNKICIAYIDDLIIDHVTKPPQFEDKTPWIVTINIFDNKGDVYLINQITKNRENYLCLIPKNYDEWLEISNKEVSFVNMVIRSNRSIQVSKIEWETYNSWDLK